MSEVCGARGTLSLDPPAHIPVRTAGDKTLFCISRTVPDCWILLPWRSDRFMTFPFLTIADWPILSSQCCNHSRELLQIHLFQLFSLMNVSFLHYYKNSVHNNRTHNVINSYICGISNIAALERFILANTEFLSAVYILPPTRMFVSASRLVILFTYICSSTHRVSRNRRKTNHTSPPVMPIFPFHDWLHNGVFRSERFTASI